MLWLIKTCSDLLVNLVIPKIQELHPYDLPEIITLPVVGGLEPNLDWVLAENRSLIENLSPDFNP